MYVDSILQHLDKYTTLEGKKRERQYASEPQVWYRYTVYRPERCNVCDNFLKLRPFKGCNR